jgi:hypothetical protein
MRSSPGVSMLAPRHCAKRWVVISPGYTVLYGAMWCFVVLCVDTAICYPSRDAIARLDSHRGATQSMAPCSLTLRILPVVLCLDDPVCEDLP